MRSVGLANPGRDRPRRGGQTPTGFGDTQESVFPSFRIVRSQGEWAVGRENRIVGSKLAGWRATQRAWRPIGQESWSGVLLPAGVSGYRASWRASITLARPAVRGG